METLYKEILDHADVLTRQIRGHLLELVGAEGPALAIIDPDRHVQTTHPGKTSFLLGDNQTLVGQICNRLDDGEEPLVVKVKGGCVAGCQLSTERAHCGYLLMFLEGYAPETVRANMMLLELIFAQAGLVCELVEKNNQLHHLQLVHLSRNSSLLST